MGLHNIMRHLSGGGEFFGLVDDPQVHRFAGDGVERVDLFDGGLHRAFVG